MSNETEVIIKGNPKEPIKVAMQGDLHAIKLVIPYNHPDLVADDIEITPYQLLEILRVNHLIPFFQKKS